ncbi:tyrosine-type recombinase/integrase [Flagellimonas olearia]|nr:site-specific integrase [Allomuricauda olearia]
MKTTLTSTHGVFRFGLKDSVKSLKESPKKESLIMLHFASKGKRFKKSIGFKSSLQNWDSTKQRIKTGKGMMTNAYKINAFLNDIQTFAEEELSSMVKNDNSINVNNLSELIGHRINGTEKEEAVNENERLVHYSENLLESKKKRIGATTYRSYNQTLKLLKLYEKQYKTTLTFDEIDLNFYRSFVDMLEDEGFSLNTIGKHIKNLKTFLNDALVNGVSNNIIFKNREFKSPKEITTDIYLTNEEIKVLAKKDFSKRPLVEQARDIFLIGCYTGQRVSDYNGLNDENIEDDNGHKLIKIKQKKTDNIVYIPVIKEIMEVMKRYDNKFPPKMSEPILRKNIKTACSAVDFKELVKVSCTKGGKLVQGKVPKFLLVKTHTARRSFCTNHYVAGKSVQNIMIFSGHKTEREFYKYIRVEKKQEALAAMKSGFFD